MQLVIIAAEEGDINTLKGILEAIPGYINARFSYNYEVSGVPYEVSSLHNSHDGLNF